MGWVSVEDRLPELGDYSVLAYFAENGSIEMVHVQDYFQPITAGKVDGEQQFTKWYISNRITHWHPMPEAPQ